MRELSNEEMMNVSGGSGCQFIEGGNTYEEGYTIPQPGGGSLECFNGVWIIT